ncbi:unannotated protein [freshwater metagenome]|uniref:Unannotated protein n=1 Tax=freshwater metagenome TaxID=449393 RepID=A0A6J6R7B5_9ZZZZ
MLEHHEHVLQGVGGRPRSIGPGERLVEVVDQALDRGGAGRLLRVGRRRVVVRDGSRGAHLDRLDVGGVVAGGAPHIGVLADRGLGQELLRARSAHGPGGRLDDGVVEAQPVEDADVGVAVELVAAVEPGIVDVEGVGVLHHELAPAQQAGPGACLVAVLRLDLVDREGQILVGGVQVLHDEGEHLLVRRAEEVVAALAVLQAEEVVAVLRPAVGRLVGLAGQQRGERQLLRPHRIHLLADDALDPAQDLQSQGEPGVDAGRGAADVARAHQQPVRRDLGVRGVLSQGPHEQGRHPHDHGGKGTARGRSGRNEFGSRDNRMPVPCVILVKHDP